MDELPQKPSHYQLIDPALSSSLRKALDGFAQDLLDMASYHSKIHRERQRLLDQKSDLGQAFRRTSNPMLNQCLAKDFATVSTRIQDMDAGLIEARQQGLPDAESRFFVRLKRMHGRLPAPKAHKFLVYSRSTYKAIRTENMRLAVLLSIPAPNVLDELAHHLLTSSLPFTEDSFFIMMKKLHRLRYTSMARSAYYHLLSAGYVPPDNPKEISPLLRIASSIHDRKGFHNLMRSVRRSGMTLDNSIYEALVIGYLKMGRTARAMKAFQDMLSDGLRPRLTLLTRLLHDCGTHRDWRRGKEIWRMIKILQQQGDLIPDRWAYYDMWRLCQKCTKYFIGRNIRQEALEQGINIGDIVKRPFLRGLPVRRLNKSPQLLHYYDSFTQRNFDNALRFNNLVSAATSLRKQLIVSSSKLAQEEIEKALLRRQQQLRGSLVRLDAIAKDEPPEPFSNPNREIQTLINIHQALRDEETSDILDEALAEYLHHTHIAETLLHQNVLESNRRPCTNTPKNERRKASAVVRDSTTIFSRRGDSKVAKYGTQTNARLHP
jgi:pentatricopeptide repeat protein